MDFSQYLNDHQLEAVTTKEQHVRVVAGAGSGKTRVLTYRIAFLLEEMDVKPENILAITFTNKVANEMKERIVKLIPEVSSKLLIRTFHSFCAYFLRHEISVLDYPLSFTIYDEDDQTKIVKDIVSEMGLKKSDPLVNKSLSFIRSMKLKEKYPDDISEKEIEGEIARQCKEVYELYEQEKNRMYGLDFDDLLLKTNQILKNYPEIRIKWQNRIQHILIDEFQDTNDSEYRLVEYLMTPDTSLYVVGDPDQTIYTWRGANQNIILNLNKKHKNIASIVLDRNYRSTQTILNAANKLIAHNRLRIPKDLYSINNIGQPIIVKGLGSNRAEAKWVAREIKMLHDNGSYAYQDIVVLYRSSYVTLEFEQELTAFNIPYRIYGNVKFYQRKEVKDILAYFNLIVNHSDDISFERIINVPRRQIGETTINIIKQEARDSNKSIYEYVSSLETNNNGVSKLTPKTINSLKILLFTLKKAEEDIQKNEEAFAKILEDMVTSIGYLDYLAKEDEGEDRIENVRALFADLRSYFYNNPETSFEEYLQNIALMSAQDEMVGGDMLTLMTAHTAKGLEYPVVFVVRFNQGIFPHNRSISEGGYESMEEERRLAYVAFTRAKERLYISYSQGFSYVAGGELAPSFFIKESGLNLPSLETRDYSFTSKKKVREYHFEDDDSGYFSQETPIRQTFSQTTTNNIGWELGDIVIHKTLGVGKVVAIEGDGIITVDFEQHGLKSLLGSHPSLTKGGHKS